MPLNSRTPLAKNNLEKLYNNGHSMTEIAETLSCSVHKVAYWMEKYNLTRRTLSQAIYLKANPEGDPFKIKTDLDRKEMFLLGLGLGIYWGEGERISKDKVRVANSNPEVIKAFIRFLLDICQLKKHKLLYQIICFNDSNLVETKKYWSDQLGVSQEKFGKIVQIPTQGKGTYKKKSSKGVCILTVSSIKLKPWIMKELQKLAYLPGWLSGRANSW